MPSNRLHIAANNDSLCYNHANQDFLVSMSWCRFKPGTPPVVVTILTRTPIGAKTDHNSGLLTVVQCQVPFQCEVIPTTTSEPTKRI